jgi:Lon protease-like protein
MFPLSSVLFPGAELPLHVFEPRYRALVADCLAGDGEFGVVLIARGSEVGGGDQRFGVGTVARIASASPFADGRWALLAVGTRRFAVERWLDDASYPLAEVHGLGDDPAPGVEARLEEATAAVRRVRTLAS